MKLKSKRKRTFTFTIPATLAMMTLLVGADHAWAQSDDMLEEVLVTGIKGSLQRSMDIKRDSAGVVDAISAEDIGKFPDANLAESLQRITGVSIDRVNGEGSQVTVRGFGAQYNMVTMNGRTMPAGFTYGGGSGAGGTFGGATRAFNFANLAAESVSGVEVYKTGRADIASGGIGASVNIKTGRPLDNPGLQASVTGKLLHDTTVLSGDEWTPELSGLVSWTDDAERFGVSLTAGYSERDSSIAGAAANNWNIAYWDADAIANNQNNLYSWARDGSGNIAATIVNAPDDGQLYARPNDFRWSFAERERERINAQLTAQYAPSDALTMTLDYTFAEVETWEQRGEWTLWFANGSSADIVVFDDSAVVTPVFYHETVFGKDMGYEQQLREQTNTLDSVGFNVAWDVTDSLSLNFDVHDSSMENLPTGPGDSGEIAISLGAPVGTSQWVDFSGDLPVGSYTWADDGTQGTRGNANGVLDEEDFGTQQGRIFYAAQLTELTQAKLSGAMEFDENSRLEFGFDTISAEVTQQASTRQVNLGTWGVNNPGEITDYIYMFSLADQYDDYDMNGSFPSGVRAFDVGSLCNHTVTLYPNPDSGVDWLCEIERNFTQDNRVEEDINAIYLQYALEFELADMPVNLLAGVRYEETDLTSTSFVRLPRYRVWQDNNDFQITVFDDTMGKQPAVVNFEYDNTLPNIDLDIAFTESLKGRFSASQTIARANYGQLFVQAGNFSQTDPTYYIGSQPTATAQNPRLLPLESTNLDLSLEWYYGEASYASIGYFRKDVDNFISTGQSLQTHYGMRDASNGPRVIAAAAALEALDIIVDNTSLFVMTAVLDNPADFPNGADDFVANGNVVDAQFAIDVAAAYDIHALPEDPETVWLTSQPTNNREATIDGFELAFQHFFGDSGFGVQANYTMVDGDVEFNDLGDPTQEQFALLGLSDTANLVLIYENAGLQARLAYNWRDEFLSQTNQGGSRNPVYVDEYSQLDMNVSYDVSENFTVFFEGLNLTEENVRWRTRSHRMTQYLEDLGARYQIGGRYTF